MTSSLPSREYLREVQSKVSLDDIYSAERAKKWKSMTSDQQKESRESLVFENFARVSRLSIEVMGHKNEKPPLPDISTTVGGQPYYFELSEVTDEGLARRVSISEQTGAITGGSFSQAKPLLRMLSDKCKKSYSTNGVPVDLLLYYDKQYPLEGATLELMQSAEVSELIAGSQYKRVWIYHNDWPSGRVLWRR